MRKIEHSASVIIYDSIEELSFHDQELLKIAIAQMDSAYAPYSQFKVGASARTKNGNIYGGCNQENASYPLCICGERVALYHAGAVEPMEPITTLAITVRSELRSVEGLISPCGACRQVISEFEHRHKHNIEIYLKSDGPEVYYFESIKSLLPFDFNGSFL
jgi:cytidine deaminase